MTHWHSGGRFKESFLSNGFHIIYSIKDYIWIRAISSNVFLMTSYIYTEQDPCVYHSTVLLLWSLQLYRWELVWRVVHLIFLLDVNYSGYAFYGNISQIFLGIYLFMYRLQMTICYIYINHLFLRCSSSYVIYLLASVYSVAEVISTVRCLAVFLFTLFYMIKYSEIFQQWVTDRLDMFIISKFFVSK